MSERVKKRIYENVIMALILFVAIIFFQKILFRAEDWFQVSSIVSFCWAFGTFFSTTVYEDYYQKSKRIYIASGIMIVAVYLIAMMLSYVFSIKGWRIFLTYMAVSLLASIYQCRFLLINDSNSKT